MTIHELRKKNLVIINLNGLFDGNFSILFTYSGLVGMLQSN